VIGSILRYRKQKKSGKVFPKNLPRRWRLLASGLQILTVLNLVVLIVQAMTFQRLENILWQFILFGILGIALLLLLALYLGKVRQHEQSKRKWLSHLSFVFISVTILNVLYWQLYRFWVI
jgi:chromate transport protein ChrA